MQLTINGESREIEDVRSLSDLLNAIDVSSSALAVELNGQVLNATMFDATELEDGDRLELVRLVGGG